MEHFADEDGFEALVLAPGVVFAFDETSRAWLGNLGKDMDDIQEIITRWGDGSNVDCGAFSIESSYSTGIRFDGGFYAPGFIYEIECGDYPAKLYYECDSYQGRIFPERADIDACLPEILGYIRQGLLLAAGATPPKRLENPTWILAFNKPGIKVEADPSRLAELRDVVRFIDINGTAEKFGQRFDKEIEVWIDGDHVLYVDWTTGIDFGHESDGGGYTITLANDPIYGPSIAECYYEWYDSYAQEYGWNERNDEKSCLHGAIAALIAAGNKL